MEERVFTTKATEKLAYQLAGKLKPGNVLALYGDLGSGKTTFVRYLTKALNSDSKVQSPTFVLHRKYNANLNGIKSINHLDLYRLQSLEECEDLGLWELIKSKDALTVVEWPELMESGLPADTIKIKFLVAGENVRIINVQNIA